METKKFPFMQCFFPLWVDKINHERFVKQRRKNHEEKFEKQNCKIYCRDDAGMFTASCGWECKQ